MPKPNTITIGFDAKRAAQNMTGLGAYSRFVLSSLHSIDAPLRYMLYTPSPQRAQGLSLLPPALSYTLRTPQSWPWRMVPSLWRTLGITGQLRRDGVALYHGLSNELPLNIARARHTRTVVTIHDLIFMRHPEWYKPIDRRIYSYKFGHACHTADRIIAVSECTKRDIVHYFGTDPSRIDVLYQGCNPAYRQPATDALKADVRQRHRLPERYILYVGTIEPRKNLLLLARALPLLRDKDIEVVAVGRRTPYADTVEAYVREHRLGNRFHMLHGVADSDLPAIYQQAAVFVYPSRYEGFGIPLLEAISSGVPAIACTGSCLEEAGGRLSLYVDPDDAQALANSLTQVLAYPDMRRHMIAAGHAYAARFEPCHLAMQLMDIYRKTLAGE